MKKWLQLVKVAVPYVIMGLAPELAPLAPLIVTGISEAEQLPGSTGAEKKAHVITLVQSGIVATNVAAKKQVIDPQTATVTAGAVVDATVGAINVVHQIHAAQQPAPPQ